MATEPLRERLRLVIIGNGMASLRLVEQIIARAPHRFTLTVLGAEASPAYNRVLLSSLLAGDNDDDGVQLRSRDWYAAQGVRLICGATVQSIDTVAKVAVTAEGTRHNYDQLVFAVGSQAIRLPVPGADLPGVMVFRALDDVAAMKASVQPGYAAVVIGGGLLGIEAASGLARRGAKVTLLHVMDRLMERRLDARGAAFLLDALRRRGIRVILKAQTQAITGDSTVDGVLLADGGKIAADLVVMAVGIKPNAALARAAGVAVGRGIIVDDQMATNVADIFAIGECAEHRGIVHGLIEPAYAQADVLASCLCGEPAAFAGMAPATNLKVSGVPVFSAGDMSSDSDSVSSAVIEARANGTYRRLVFSGDRLIGCVLVGDTEDGLWYRDLIRSGLSIAAMRLDLIHGRAFVSHMSEKAA